MSSLTRYAVQGIYTMVWEGAYFEIDYVTVERGDIWAELQVFLDLPHSKGSVFRARLNLIRGNSRRDAAKELEARNGSFGLDWPEMMEEATAWVVDAVRSGEPEIMLMDAEAPEQGDWLLPPLILGRHPTIWFGDGGSGKSYLALAAAATIASGHGLLDIEPSVTMPVAFLDWEFDAWEHRQRLEKMMAGSPAEIVYIPCSAPLVEQVDRLRGIFRKRKIGFAVLDSVGAACGGEPEAADVALAFFGALRRLEVGSLLIAHTTKNGSDDRPFGSAYWHNMARCSWLVKKDQEPGQGGRLSMGLFNKKANSAALASPIGYKVDFMPEATVFSQVEVSDNPELAKGLTLVSRIAHAISTAPKSYFELAEELDSTPESIRGTVKRNRGRFVMVTRPSDKVSAVGLVQRSA